MTAESLDPAPLLAWYRAVARPLPWRLDPRPYHVLLSELMCQQTRVETALPYYRKFLERWPTIEDLAAASEQEVLEAWAGLGYYSRARNLHRCASAAVARGGLPSTADALRELPGVGPYTAGAIASIAFGERAVAVDGNVQRVMARWAAIDDPIASSSGKRAVAGAAAALHGALPDGGHPGDLNQALMELGARVCTPRSPDCPGCPVAPACRARAEGRVGELPRVAARKPPVEIPGVAGLLSDDRGPLLVRNPDAGLLGGLWTPPVVMSPEGSLEAELRAAFADAGVRVELGRQLGEVVHVFSHRRLVAAVFEVRAEVARPEVVRRWTGVRFGGEEGLSALGRRVLALASAPPLFALAAEGSAPPYGAASDGLR